GQHRHGKPQQRRPGMAEAADLALQDRLQALLDQRQIDKDLAAIDAKYKETARKTKTYTDDAATRMLQQLREQEASLQAQLSGNDKLTATQRAQVEFAQKIADLKTKGILTAEQKSLMANQGAITAQLAENAALEGQIRKREQLVELERIRISILRDSGQTEAANAAQFELDFAQRRLEYERQGNTEAIKRLDTLRQIQEANGRAGLPTGTVEGVSQAPSADGISPSVGGASAEMIRLEQDRMALENWRIMELEKQTAFLEAKAINEEVYAERVRNINEQSAENMGSISSAMFSAQLGAAEDLVGNIAGLAAQAAGEQSGLYKVMFAAQKAFAIAQT
ncbi:hypothetical protein V2S84_22455, partial [Azotobacter chroococcum]|nr:hypothetical protein [Azotobacter chroococcum]